MEFLRDELNDVKLRMDRAIHSFHDDDTMDETIPEIENGDYIAIERQWPRVDRFWKERDFETVHFSAKMFACRS